MEEGVEVDEGTSVVVGAFTYYYGSDENWYAKLEDNYYMVQPIKWRVLTSNYDNGKKLLLAENVLINCMFYDNYTGSERGTIKQCDYKESRIRAYLNGIAYNKEGNNSDEFVGKGFFQTAFTSSIRSRIKDTEVDNSARSTNPDANANEWNNGENSCACENTTDKIFLLSEQEVTTAAYGFAAHDVYKGDNSGTTTSTRIRMATDFAKANGTYTFNSSNLSAYWWLRSPHWSYETPRVVRDDGQANYEDWPHSESRGVCPALCVSN